MVSAKATFEGNTRRFTIADAQKWADVIDQLRRVFAIPEHHQLHVCYEDSDGDEITLSSDAELAEAVRESANTGGVLRFKLGTAAFSDDFVKVRKTGFFRSQSYRPPASQD
jgi:hypothetical protein